MARRRSKKDLNEYPATITGLSHEGRGITHIEGKPVFLFNALPDEEVKFLYTKKRNQVSEGMATQIIEASSDRIEPKCPHFLICGGCGLQHISNEYQQTIKRNSALELLAQQHVTPEQVIPTLTGDSWGYRRKARIGAKFVFKKEIMMVGFRERNSSLIANIDSCEVLDPRVGQHITTLKQFIYELEARATIPQIEIALTDTTAALIIRHLEPLSDNDIEKIKAFAATHKFQIYLQPKGLDSIYLLVGEHEKLSYQLPQYNLTFEFLPFQFTQVNEKINQQMVAQALDLLDLQTEDRLLDLFCGIGNFSLAAATQAQHVTGVEADGLAIEQAKANAQLNKLTNTEFHVGNLFEDCSDLAWARQQYNKILLDPPRSGAAEIIELMPRWQPQRIVYVSCNPTTFARDAALLQAQGYTLKTFGTMDMFPHTQHTEVMGLFCKA